MRISPAIVTLVAAVACLAGVQAVCAQTGHPRQPAGRTASAHGQPAGAASRQKTGLPRSPAPDERSWMDRASAASNGGGGGGM